MIFSSSTRAQYSEAEVAETLGLSVEELRSLIRRHIVAGEEDMPSTPVRTFQPSDVVLLRILAGKSSGPTTRH